jgi:hypothetical protein
MMSSALGSLKQELSVRKGIRSKHGNFFMVMMSGNENYKIFRYTNIFSGGFRFPADLPVICSSADILF